MKAIQIRETGGPEVLQTVELPTPTPQPGEAVVRTESISVNFADVLIREGLYPVMPPLPAILGLEGAGVVEAVGPGVSGITPGQRVAFITNGCYAEKVAVDSSALVSLPDEIDSDTAAAFSVVYLTAYHLLHTVGKADNGAWVLLYAAAGGVGTAVLQIAAIAGLRVIALTSSEEKGERAKALGAKHAFRYGDPDLVDRVKEATGGDGVDLILDSVAGPDFGRNFDMLAPLGQVLWFGFAGGMPPAELLQPLGAHFVRGVGVRTFHLTYTIAEPYPDRLRESLGTIMGWLIEERIRPVIGERLPLEEAGRAHELLQSRKTVGKIILKP